jgi:23S rRNA pseudouridine1911/1915/1917 synthase
LAVNYKPAGILVSGNKFVTISNGLSRNLKKSKQLVAVKSQPVHRQDYPTSCPLLISKTYFAITIDKMNTKETINSAIDKKSALTAFEVIKKATSKRFKFLNLVELQPKIGRKHLLSIGNSNLGNKRIFFRK